MTNEVTTQESDDGLVGVSQEGLRLLERIAVFKSSGISDQALCDSFGFDIATLNGIIGDPVFKEIEGRILSEKITENLEVDNSWDSLEAKALENLTKTVNVNKDPELNLRIAAVANKAVRRARVGNTTLDAKKGEGARATITLSQRMISKLGHHSPENSEVHERKIEATFDMSSEDIESIFSGDTLPGTIPTLDDSDE